MTTTSLIVELLIIGFTFLFGVFLIFFSCTDICLGFLLTMDKWVTLIILIVIALAYVMFQTNQFKKGVSLRR